MPGWLIVDDLPMFHRCSPAEGAAGAEPIVHVHGFGISGTYLEPTAALLAPHYRNYVPDLPGMGRSIRPRAGLDLPGLARSLVAYCDAVGVDQANLVGNSLGCPIIVEVASSFPDRVRSAVLVSPAGGPNNRPLGRALWQMTLDGLREPPSLLPIAGRDYLRFGVLASLALFRAMTRYPTLENLPRLVAPTLVIMGERDPLVRISRAFVLAPLPHVTAVKVPGAHALNYSAPELISELVKAHVNGEPLTTTHGPRRFATLVDIRPRPPLPPPAG